MVAQHQHVFSANTDVGSILTTLSTRGLPEHLTSLESLKSALNQLLNQGLRRRRVTLWNK